MNQKQTKNPFLPKCWFMQEHYILREVAVNGWFILTGMLKGGSCAGSEFLRARNPERKALETLQQDLLKHSLVFFPSYLRRE